MIAGRFAIEVDNPAESATLRAYDTQLERWVRLYVVERDDALATELLASPPHPHLAVVRYDVFDDGLRFLVVDEVTGPSLLALETPARDVGQRWIDQLHRATAHLHARGVAHGAIDASHVVIADGNAVLTGLPQGGPAWRDRRALRRLAVALGLVPIWRRRSVAVPAVALLVGVLLSASLVGSEGRPTSPTRGAVGIDAPAAPAQRDERAAAATPTPSPAVGIDVPARLDRVGAPVLDIAEPVTVSPERIGVYTMTALNLGKFDVYNLAAGQPSFQKRNLGLTMLWSHIATLDDGWLLFYRSADGRLETAPIEPNGHLGFGDQSIQPSFGWTHLTNASGELAWLYRHDTGAARVIRFSDGYYASDRSFADAIGPGFDHVVGIGGRRVLHYASASGRAVVVTLDATGRIVDKTAISLSPRWMAVAATSTGHLVGVLPTGAGSIVRIVDGVVENVQQVDLGGSAWARAFGLADGVVVTGIDGSAMLIRVDDGKARVTKWRVPLGSVVASIR